MFAENGFEGTSIRAIATASSTQLTDLYRNYDDKRALYLKVCEVVLGGKAQRYGAILHSRHIPEKRLLNFTASLYRDLRTDPAFIKLFVRELISPSGTGLKEIADKHFAGQFTDAANCVEELTGADGNPQALDIYAMLLGYVQLAEMDQAAPKRLPLNRPIVMARYILNRILPTTDWNSVSVKINPL